MDDSIWNTIHVNLEKEIDDIGKSRRLSATAVLENLKKQLGIQTNKELARLLGIQPNTISTWKKRNSLDYGKLIDLIGTFQVDLNGIFLDKLCLPVMNDRTKVMSVPVEYQYQYVSKFRDKTFLQEMPKYAFPFISGEEDVRAFQVSGLNSLYSFKGVLFAIGRFSEEITAGKIYVLVNKVKGIFIGLVEADVIDPDRIYVIDEKKGITNDKIQMKIDDIVEAWKVTNIVLNDDFG